MIVLTRTLNLIQSCKITVHANSPCKNALKYSELGLGFCREKLTLTNDILADNDSGYSCMHKDLDGWSNNALFLRCYRPAVP